MWLLNSVQKRSIFSHVKRRISISKFVQSEIRKKEKKKNTNTEINMAVITLRISHLCIFNLLMFSAIASVIDLTQQTPLCGTMDGSPQKDSDKIYFKDRSQRIRTVEVNGTIYACYPDGTMVDTTSSSSAENSNERITGYQLADRIHDGNKSIFTLIILIIFFCCCCSLFFLPLLAFYRTLIILKQFFGPLIQ